MTNDADHTRDVMAMVSEIAATEKYWPLVLTGGPDRDPLWTVYVGIDGRIRTKGVIDWDEFVHAFKAVIEASETPPQAQE